MKKQQSILIPNIIDQSDVNIARKELNIFEIKAKTEVFVQK